MTYGWWATGIQRSEEAADMATTNWTDIRKSLMSARDRATLPPDVRLPILPIAVSKFSQRAEDPGADPRELGKIIETDSGLTCELLRYVNSSACGLRNRVSSAQHAIALLGVRESKLFLLQSAVKRAMRGTESQLINIPHFWAANLERALLARATARLLNADGELAFAAGMLQDFLLPLLANELYPAYLYFVKQQETNSLPLPKYEREQFQWDHAETAAQIMLDWNFPDDLIVCVLVHHRGLKLLGDPQLGRTAAAAVAVSALMPGPLREIPDGIERLIRLEQHWPAFKLLEIAQCVDEQYVQLSPGVPNPFSFLRACRKALAATG